MNRLGIMQGRLLPPVGGRIQAFPVGRWAEEFPRAAQAKLSAIEWIYEVYGEDSNPIATDAGIRELKTLIDQSGVGVYSVCADYFMDRPLVGCSDAERVERLERLRLLLAHAGRLGVVRMVLPFVDASRMKSEDDEEQVVQALLSCVPDAERAGVELHLETDLGPAEFRRLMGRLTNPLFKVNYDSGNSASLGFHPNDEFAAYGDRVGSVHIKDRKRGGTTVPLGSGDTDFPALFRNLESLKYSGDMVLQVARGPEGDEVAWAKANRAFVAERWKRLA